MSAAEATAITLRALAGGHPLDDPGVREMVIATANAIAERQGVAVLGLETTAEHITVRLRCGRIAALGFAAELRRVTTRWFTAKYGAATLWGEEGDGGAAGEWKGA